MTATRYVISDLHLGDGSFLDDFDQDERFQRFLSAIGERKRAELIINGDFIDFASIALPEESARSFSRMGCTEEESLQKFELVHRAHPLVFGALKEFIGRGNRLVIIPGNHDIDLFWPRIWARVAEVLGNPDGDHLHFEFTGIYRCDGLYVEHGNQYFADSLFENFTHPFLRDPKTGELRLERSWSTCFISYFANSLRRKKPFINNVKPVSSLVFLGMQEESRWFRLQHAYKLSRFILHVGFPPFREVRTASASRSAARLESRRQSRKRVLRALTSFTIFRNRRNLESLSQLIQEEEEPEQPLLETEPPGFGAPPPDATQSREEKGSKGAFIEDELALDPLSIREDILSVKARELLLGKGDIDVVAFGHDHRYYSNQHDPTVGGKRGKYYINTGTWIPMLFLTRSQENLSWKDLENKSLYHQHLTYAVTKSGFGRPTAELKGLKAASRA
jgi:UDP-2,3-diacylglucosamine pyrophosphatase LpxH